MWDSPQRSNPGSSLSLFVFDHFTSYHSPASFQRVFFMCECVILCECVSVGRRWASSNVKVSLWVAWITFKYPSNLFTHSHTFSCVLCMCVSWWCTHSSTLFFKIILALICLLDFLFFVLFCFFASTFCCKINFENDSFFGGVFVFTFYPDF